MALSKLSGDEQGILFVQLCNVLDPRGAMYFSITSHELRDQTQALQQQLRAEYEVAAALCRKMGMRSCKQLREATMVNWQGKDLSAADLTTLGTLGSVLSALVVLVLVDHTSGVDGKPLVEGAAGPDGVLQLVEGLGVGALPSVTYLRITSMHVGDAGASALAVALGQGALSRLKSLMLDATGIGDAGLVALAPALRWLPALQELSLAHNVLGDVGLAALVAPPPPPAGAPPPPIGVVHAVVFVELEKLKVLSLVKTKVSDAGCAALATALDSGTLPALNSLDLRGVPASALAIYRAHAARIGASLRAAQQQEMMQLQQLHEPHSLQAVCESGHALEVIHAWCAGGTCDVCQRYIAEGEDIWVCVPCNRNWWACTECKALVEGFEPEHEMTAAEAMAMAEAEGLTLVRADNESGFLDVEVVGVVEGIEGLGV
tara:strand:+ start:317 stop:1612 length:1296 start_codon:yes stop_codon:yes gene_type:complete